MAGSHVEADLDGKAVGSATADPDGRYRLRLPLGTYRFVATAPGPLKTTASADLTVTSGSATLDLTVDTGMR